MQDFFSRIGAAAAAPASVVRPVLPTPYEPALDERVEVGVMRRFAQTQLDELALEVESTPAVGGPRAAEGVRPSARHPAHWEQSPVAESPDQGRAFAERRWPQAVLPARAFAEASSEQAAPLAAPWVLAPPSSAAPRRGSELPAVLAASGAEADARGNTPTASDFLPLPPPRPGIPLQQELPLAAPRPHPLRAESSPPPAPAVVTVAAERAPAATPRAAPPPLGHAAPRAREAGARTPLPPPAAPPAPPTIQVHIGRVEVRAEVEAAPAPVHSRAPQRTAPPLSEYLAQRRLR